MMVMRLSGTQVHRCSASFHKNRGRSRNIECGKNNKKGQRVIRTLVWWVQIEGFD